MARPYIIKISSQKGGVGKTTVAVNLAAKLSQFDYNVLIVDADTTNPSVGFHMGLEEANIGIRDVMYGKASIKQATVPHSITGMHILPGTVYSKAFTPGKEEFVKLMNTLSKENYDFIIVDTSPGIAMSEVQGIYDEAIIITSPEMSSCASSIRLAEAYSTNKIKHNLVVNRVRNKPYEVSLAEIEQMYGNKVKGYLVEDEAVPISISEHIPVCITDPKSKFSREITKLSELYASGRGTRMYDTYKHGKGFIAFLKKLLHTG